MNVRELIEELKYLDQDAEVYAVQQPNYPLVAEIRDELVAHPDGRVYIKLHDAYDYYQSPRDWEDENEENEDEEDV